MTSYFRLAALAVPAVAALAVFTQPARAGDQDFGLVNQTGYQIDEVRVSPASASNWGNDIMGANQTLDNGTKLNITFRPDNSICKYDLQVVYHDKTKAEWGNLDLCTINQVTIYYNQGSGETRAVTE